MPPNPSSFFSEIRSALEAEKPLVVYRRPGENALTAYVQSTQKLHLLTSFKEQGFVFAPFSGAADKVVFPQEECVITRTVLTHLEPFTPFSEGALKQPGPAPEKYIQLLEKALDHLRNAHLKKVVLSRAETLVKESMEVLAVYQRMLRAYPNAFVYLWFHPQVGMWMGASPEAFITIEKAHFKAMALAGTQAFKGSTSVHWGEKEKEEQQLVTDFITGHARALFGSCKVVGPYTVRAGSLLHLCSDISATILGTPPLAALLARLHPTPAVCGIPLEAARSFIQSSEGYDRAYYTGYLGEMNVNNTTRLFVNLRCMQVTAGFVKLYVGGGITAASNPQAEWEETVLKAQVMKAVL